VTRESRTDRVPTKRAEADGAEVEFGSARYERLEPPHQDCDGGEPLPLSVRVHAQDRGSDLSDPNRPVGVLGVGTCSVRHGHPRSEDR